MRSLLIVFFSLTMAACATVPFDVRMLTIAEVRAAENCGHDVIENYGCWRPISPAGGCKIMVERPRHSGDIDRLATLGKEVWKCLTANKEY